MTAAPTRPAVRLTGVGKRYPSSPWGGARTALAGVDLECSAGTLTLLAGPNGSGKSTLLKILAGLTTPDTGMLVRPEAPAGYLPEALRLPGRLTAGEILSVFSMLQQPAPGPAACERALETVGLVAEASTRAGALSHGQRQRLGLAAALLGSPELLLLDEPFNGLDPQAMREFAGVLRGLRAAGKILVVSSHLFAPLDGFCDQFAVLRAGRLSGVRRSGHQAGLTTSEMEAAYFAGAGGGEQAP
jgi:ABC-type multidrug transport system ATPase subunit